MRIKLTYVCKYWNRKAYCKKITILMAVDNIKVVKVNHDHVFKAISHTKLYFTLFLVNLAIYY